MTDGQLQATLERLVPKFENVPPDWEDALRRAGSDARPQRAVLAAVVAAALAIAAALAFSPVGHGLVSGTFDRLSGWIDGQPGKPAPQAEQRALDEANARTAAPIPTDTELGLLVSHELDGESFELLGFRDGASLCLRLRSSAGTGAPIVKAPANCVIQQLLVDLAKPLAVVAAANPFPRRAKLGLQALYGFAADGVAQVELTSQGGKHRLRVENNAFLYLYRGEGPSMKGSRLAYDSDVPSRATALDSTGHAVGSVEIMSLKRGFPGAPRAAALPGPSVVDREMTNPRVGWLDSGEERGERYDWRDSDGARPREIAGARLFRPNPATSLRVLVISMTPSAQLRNHRPYCITALWPLEERPTGFTCSPDRWAVGVAETVFDDQFPVYYGLLPDDVTSLELILENGARERVPVVDNVFAVQASSASPAKLVGYDAAGRVVLLRVLAL